jgi:hypothetical protein
MLDALEMPSIKPQMVYTRRNLIGVDARPDWAG